MQTAAEGVWRQFAAAASKEFSEDDLLSLCLPTLQGLIQMYGFTSPIESARIEVQWKYLCEQRERERSAAEARQVVSSGLPSDAPPPVPPPFSDLPAPQHRRIPQPATSGVVSPAYTPAPKEPASIPPPSTARPFLRDLEGTPISPRPGNTPSLLSTMSTEVSVHRAPTEALGLSFHRNTLVLASCPEGGAASRWANAGRFVGQYLTHVNSQPVRTQEDVKRAVDNNTYVTLRFSVYPDEPVARPPPPASLPSPALSVHSDPIPAPIPAPVPARIPAPAAPLPPSFPPPHVGMLSPAPSFSVGPHPPPLRANRSLSPDARLISPPRKQPEALASPAKRGRQRSRSVGCKSRGVFPVEHPKPFEVPKPVRKSSLSRRRRLASDQPAKADPNSAGNGTEARPSGKQCGAAGGGGGGGGGDLFLFSSAPQETDKVQLSIRRLRAQQSPATGNPNPTSGDAPPATGRRSDIRRALERPAVGDPNAIESTATPAKGRCRPSTHKDEPAAHCNPNEITRDCDPYAREIVGGGENSMWWGTVQRRRAADCNRDAALSDPNSATYTSPGKKTGRLLSPRKQQDHGPPGIWPEGGWEPGPTGLAHIAPSCRDEGVMPGSAGWDDPPGLRRTQNKAFVPLPATDKEPRSEGRRRCSSPAQDVHLVGGQHSPQRKDEWSLQGVDEAWGEISPSRKRRGYNAGRPNVDNAGTVSVEQKRPSTGRGRWSSSPASAEHIGVDSNVVTEVDPRHTGPAPPKERTAMTPNSRVPKGALKKREVERRSYPSAPQQGLRFIPPSGCA